MSSLLDNLLERVSGAEKEDIEEDELTLEEVPEDEGEDLSEEFELELEEPEEETLETEEELETVAEPTTSEPTAEEESSFDESGGEVEEAEIKEIEDELDDLSSKISKLEREQREMGEDISEVEDRAQKLFKVYEILFRGLNPYDDDVEEVDKDMLGEDVFEIFKELTGEQAERAVPPKAIKKLEKRIERIESEGVEGTAAGSERINQLENRIDELEETVQGKVAEEVSGLEAEYEEALEEAPGERPEAKWEIGDTVYTPENQKVEVMDRHWDSAEEEWIYDCELAEGGV